MTKIGAYNVLQERFGKEQAQAIAEFVELQEGPDLSQFATKEDLRNLELRLVKDGANTREELRKEIASTREEFTKEIAKVREDMIARMNWTTLIQVLTTVGALIALAKLI